MKMFFRNASMRNSEVWLASWGKEKATLYVGSTTTLSPEEAIDLANWILETAPQKSYTITTKFKNIPSGVTFCNQLMETEIEVEEVWE